jgi:hypothetical protein
MCIGNAYYYDDGKEQEQADVEQTDKEQRAKPIEHAKCCGIPCRICEAEGSHWMPSIVEASSKDQETNQQCSSYIAQPSKA